MRTNDVRWIQATIQALYGPDCEPDESVSMEFRRILGDCLIEPMWSTMLGRFGVPQQPEPQLIVVRSPAARPTTVTADGRGLFIFDLHLMQLLKLMAVLAAFDLDAPIVSTALTSFFAERLLVTGRADRAAILSAGARLDRAKIPRISFSTSNFPKIADGHAFIQLGFVTAHELSHLALTLAPDKAEELTEEHMALLRQFAEIRFKSLEHRDSEAPDLAAEISELAMRGYLLNQIGIASSLPLDGPLRHPMDRWDAAAREPDFVVEVAADYMAFVTVMVCMGNELDTGSLASACVGAATGLSITKYLDHVARGDLSDSLVGKEFWNLLHRRTALELAAIIWMQVKGVSLDEQSRILGVIDSHQDAYERLVLNPLLYATNFDATHDRYAHDETVMAIVRPLLGDYRAIRTFLEFRGKLGTPTLLHYIDYTLSD